MARSTLMTIGKMRRLQQCATAGGKFVILAMDHRGNLRRSLNPAAPDEVTYRQMVRFKQEIIGGLSAGASAVLLDPQYGAAQVVAAGSLPGQVGLVVAVEKSGYTGDPLARKSQLLPGWGVEKINRMGAAAVKMLLYYHPQAPNAAAQEALVAEVAEDCRRLDMPFFLEPIAFSLDPAVKKLSSSQKRPLVIETAQRLSAMGIDVLKAEFPLNIDDTPDEGLWVEACAELTEASAVPWVLLSAGVGFEEFARQTAVACQAGASGVMVGRAVWKEAVTFSGEARATFLETTGRQRMARLNEIVGAHGRPWTAKTNALQDVGPDWYMKF